jgi:hypothetical protein
VHRKKKECTKTQAISRNKEHVFVKDFPVSLQ